MPGGGGKLLRPRLSTHRPRAPGQFGVTYGVFPPPSIRPTPTLPSTVRRSCLPMALGTRSTVRRSALARRSGPRGVRVVIWPSQHDALERTAPPVREGV